jgi:transposase-like protein
MPPRIPDTKRQAIADAIRAGGKRNEIAREHGVSYGTVTNIATEQNLDQPFDRSATARATELKRVDNAALRAEISAALLADSGRLRERMWQPSEQLLPSGQIITLELPPARDVRDFAQAIQSNMRTHMEQDRHDSALGHDDAKSMLAGISEGLRAMQRVRDHAAEE